MSIYNLEIVFHRADRRFKLNKRGQLFLRVHNETLAAVAAIMVSIVRSRGGYKPLFPIPKAQSVFHRHAGGFIVFLESSIETRRGTFFFKKIPEAAKAFWGCCLSVDCMVVESNTSNLRCLSVIIPARNEQGCIASTVEHLDRELRLHKIPHEIVVVDDGSSDRTWEILQDLKTRIQGLVAIQNDGSHGFGRAVIHGLDRMTGDAAVIVMADESDDCRDVVRYWQKLNEGWDCVFGSRFLKGGGVIDYPWLKLRLNRFANRFLQLIFNIKLNDTTNAFKAYRKTAIDGCRPLIAPHFNLTVEIPLKAIVRGYSWTMIPVTWRNRKTGEAKLKINEMGSRYLFICLYVWLEKFFSHGEYMKPSTSVERQLQPNAERQRL